MLMSISIAMSGDVEDDNDDDDNEHDDGEDHDDGVDGNFWLVRLRPDSEVGINLPPRSSRIN